MSKIIWGYSLRGFRRHRLDMNDLPVNVGACCWPLTPRTCCLLGNSLCSVLLEGEISEKNLQYWLVCQHCERLGAKCDDS